MTDTIESLRANNALLVASARAAGEETRAAERRAEAARVRAASAEDRLTRVNVRLGRAMNAASVWRNAFDWARQDRDTFHHALDLAVLEARSQLALAMAWGAQAIADAEEAAASWAIGKVEDHHVEIRRLRLRAALRLSVLEAERDAARDEADRARRDLRSKLISSPAYDGGSRSLIEVLVRRLGGCVTVSDREIVQALGEVETSWSLDGMLTIRTLSPVATPDPPRIATPAEAAEIARTMVPSQHKVIAKLASPSADDLAALAHEQAAKVRREMRGDFQKRWGSFWKCPVAGCGSRCVDAGFAFVCKTHDGYGVASGYAPPPRST